MPLCRDCPSCCTIRSLKGDPRRIRDYFVKALLQGDKNLDGRISFQEFKRYSGVSKGSPQHQVMLFDIIDRDGSGEITIAEFINYHINLARTERCIFSRSSR